MDRNMILVQWRSMQRTISAVPTREPGHVRTGFARIDPRDGRLIASGASGPSTSGTAQEEILGATAKIFAAVPRGKSGSLVSAFQYDWDQVTLRRWTRAGKDLPD